MQTPSYSGRDPVREWRINRPLPYLAALRTLMMTGQLRTLSRSETGSTPQCYINCLVDITRSEIKNNKKKKSESIDVSEVLTCSSLVWDLTEQKGVCSSRSPTRCQ
ncbi:unnamed protein product [Lepidochelys kempii]